MELGPSMTAKVQKESPENAKISLFDKTILLEHLANMRKTRPSAKSTKIMKCNKCVHQHCVSLPITEFYVNTFSPLSLKQKKGKTASTWHVLIFFALTKVTTEHASLHNVTMYLLTLSNKAPWLSVAFLPQVCKHMPSGVQSSKLFPLRELSKFLEKN